MLRLDRETASNLFGRDADEHHPEPFGVGEGGSIDRIGMAGLGVGETTGVLFGSQGDVDMEIRSVSRNVLLVPYQERYGTSEMDTAIYEYPIMY